MSEETRRIVHAIHPEHPDWRWRGTVERDDGRYKGRAWPAETVERVVESMNRDLGTPEGGDAAYTVQE